VRGGIVEPPVRLSLIDTHPSDAVLVVHDHDRAEEIMRDIVDGALEEIPS
jgi:hypothetical protein